jgi:hypothetical protein
MRWAILDSSVYIGHWERGVFEEPLAAVQKAFVVRHSPWSCQNSAAGPGLVKPGNSSLRCFALRRFDGNQRRWTGGRRDA